VPTQTPRSGRTDIERLHVRGTEALKNDLDSNAVSAAHFKHPTTCDATSQPFQERSNVVPLSKGPLGAVPPPPTDAIQFDHTGASSQVNSVIRIPTKCF